MRRRLDIAMSVIGEPSIIFLDEPTSGIDPQARIEVWQTVKHLAGRGTTVLLTTQHLDEAEQLADRMLITIASGIAYTAYRLFLDLKGGIFERFQSMPIARSSVLWAHVLTSLVANLVSVVIVIGVALIMGFRSGASVAAWLAVAGILILFTLALTWLAVMAGLSAKIVDGASAFSYPLIFLPFISSAFVPTDTMPGPVAWFARNQPVTSMVNTIRALFAQKPVGGDIWTVLAWLVGILLIAYALAIAAYRRKTS